MVYIEFIKGVFMRNYNIPKIGMRNIKTAISVFICIALFNLFKRDNAFYACIAAVICMKDTYENSLSIGINRLLGTFLGGLLGIITIYLLSFLPNISTPNALITAFGTIIVIHTCTLLKKPAAVTIACIVFISIMINYPGIASYFYAINRTFDTAIGIIIAILINKYID